MHFVLVEQKFILKNIIEDKNEILLIFKNVLINILVWEANFEEILWENVQNIIEIIFAKIAKKITAKS